MGEEGSSGRQGSGAPLAGSRRRRWGRLLVLVSVAFSVTGLGGPIQAPPGVIDLRADPAAFQAQFDREVGVPRLVVLLSPA